MDGGKKNKSKENKPKDNIFDLTKLAPIELDHELQQTSTIITIDEQNKLLEEYDELPCEEWGNLTLNDCVRYLRKDGSFRKGGYFKNSWIGSFGKQNGKKCMQLSSAPHFKSAKWTVCYNDLDKLWVKKNNQICTSNPTAVDPELKNIINAQQETIEYMSKSVEQLKIDMLKINNEQKRIINLIKKLHGIKSSSSK